MNKQIAKIGSVAKQLLFGAQSQFSQTIDPITWNAEHNFIDNIFFGNDGIEYPFTYTGHQSSLDAYKKCPPLTAIINRKAQAHINGRTWVMNTKGKESETAQAKLIRGLFAKPNPLQSQKQFEAQQKIYMQLFGYCVVLFIKPVGFKDNYDATSMWNIPPTMLDIKETNKLFYQTDLKGVVQSITLTYKSQRTAININDIYIFKDFTPSMDSLIIPESRVCSLRMPINNIIGAYESRNVLINKRGAMGVLSPDGGKDGAGIAVPMRKEDKDALEAEFARYGLRRWQQKFILSNAGVKWSQIGIPTRELMLIEEVQESSKEICAGYGYPPFLLGLSDTTYSNQETAAKSLYQNTIIPEADSVNEEWTNCFQGEKYNFTISKDFAHLPVLQEDAQKQATARSTLGQEIMKEFYGDFITYNRVLELLNEDTRPGYDRYYSELLKDGLIAPMAKIVSNGNATGQETTAAA